MIKGHDIICLAPSEWRDNPVSNMHLMARLAKENRVLYIETPGSRLPTLRDAARVARRLKRWVRGPQNFSSDLATSTFTIHTPLAIPHSQHGLVFTFNRFWLSWSLGRLARRLGFSSPIVWSFSPWYSPIIDVFLPQMVIFHMVDDLSTYQGGDSQRFASLERDMIQRADLVLVASRSLWERKKGANPSTYHLPNAADVEHISRCRDPEVPLAPEMAGLPRPVIGYVGTLANWVDYDLLAELASAHPEWSLVLVGYIHGLTDPAAIARLQSLKNVHFLGQQPFSRLPQFYRGFDVCLVPFVRNEHIQYSNPTKFYEYLATGLPIVSTDIRPAQEFRDLVYIGTSQADFIAKVESAVSTLDPGGMQARLETAQQHTWDARVEQVSALIEQNLFSLKSV